MPLIKDLNILVWDYGFDGFVISLRKTFKRLTITENYKIIAEGNAKSILFVKSIIKKDSHHSEAYQKNNNLILSDKSTVHSNPQLEIYNDDVKCSHGSATGQIDDEAIYYMRTRGINEKLAKQLILNSFIDEIIEKISALDIQKNIKHKIKSYLKDGS